MKKTPHSTQIKLTGSILALGLFLAASIITIPILKGSTENRSAAVGSYQKPPVIPTGVPLCDPNGDGRTDGLDYTLVFENYGSTDPYASGDCNDDGTIDGLDLLSVIETWQP